MFQDPAAVAAAWLSALCWYDYRGGRDDNTRRAAAYGDTQMPPGQDPWTLDDRAWAQITSNPNEFRLHRHHRHRGHVVPQRH